MSHEFPQLKSVRVVVEERRAGGRRPGCWRTHEYSGLEAIPERLRPAFASPGTGAAEVDVLALLRAAYADGLTTCHHQADYLDGAGCDKTAVERAIALFLNYKTPLRLEPRTAHAAQAPAPTRHRELDAGLRVA